MELKSDYLSQTATRWQIDAKVTKHQGGNMSQRTSNPDRHGADRPAQLLSSDDRPDAPAAVIRVEAHTEQLAQLAGQAVERQGFQAVPAARSSRGCALEYRDAPMPDDLQRIVAAMRPVRVVLRHVPQLSVYAVLTIGQPSRHTLSDWRLRPRTDDPEFAAELCAVLADAGFALNPGGEPAALFAGSTLRYGGADEHTRALLSWVVQQLGCDPPRQIKAWGNDDKDLYLDLPAPSAVGVPLRRRVPVTLRADSPEALAAIEAPLRAAGFARLLFSDLPLSDDSRFRLDPGVLPALGAHLEVADLVRALDTGARPLGIDWSLYPLELIDRRSAAEGGVVIDLPFAAMRAGLLRPWASLHPSRYEVVINDDDREAGMEIEATLKAAGFNAYRRRLTSIKEGFAVRSGNQVPESLQQTVRSAIDTAMLRCGASDYVLAVSSRDGDKIEIDFPAGAHRDGRLRAELGNPGRYSVKIIAPGTAVAKPLMDDLRAQGFRKVRVEVDTDDDPTWVKYGGAPSEVLDRIDVAVARHYGPTTLPREKTWPASDNDIFIRLPASVSGAAVETRLGRAAAKSVRTVRQTLAALIGSNQQARGPLVEVTEHQVRIGDIFLDKPPAGRRHPRAPQAERFRGFCIDQVVADTLHFMAQAVRGRYPVALEGPTAASKTWAISYLAAQLGVGLYRVNLSVQSDVAELVGRFVPDTERPAMFRFQYGPAPLAMTEGAWLVLDEVNLAPTELLERSNSMLESPDPSLTLSEYDGRQITDVHSQFRVLATWNGLTYAGRQELSPAFLDRFKTRVLTAPAEAEYRALGECLVHGRQPDVVVHGVRYRGGTDQALLPELASQIDDFDRFNTALARFQAGLASMAEGGELRTRGPIAVTRRAFVDMLRETRALLAATGDPKPSRATVIRAVWQALCFCHLDRLDPSEERPKAITLLAACGIGPEAWELPR